MQATEKKTKANTPDNVCEKKTKEYVKKRPNTWTSLARHDFSAPVAHGKTTKQ